MEKSNYVNLQTLSTTPKHKIDDGFHVLDRLNQCPNQFNNK